MTPAELRAGAEALAREAGAVLREKWAQRRTIEFKDGPGNLVTDADRASEASLLAGLARRFPGHGVLAEESGASGGERPWRWIIDPLDGTTNYAHAVPHFSVSIAVEGPLGDSERGVVAAAVFDPMRDELFSAARGGGATLNGAPLRVSACASLDRALMCSGFPYDLAERSELVLGLFNRVVTRARGMRRFGSAALDLAWLAAGRYDGYFELGLKPWDVAGGALLVEEAGGQLSRVDGQRWSVPFGDVVAAAPGVFPEVQALCVAWARERDFRPRPHPEA